MPADDKSKLVKKFFRDGARYVCAQCKKRFFTKEEVEKCFDSHPVDQNVK